MLFTLLELALANGDDRECLSNTTKAKVLTAPILDQSTILAMSNTPVDLTKVTYQSHKDNRGCQ